MRIIHVAVIGLVLAGCGGKDASSSNGPTCAIGDLKGVWRFHYDQIDGQCGFLSDETITGGVQPTTASTCTTQKSDISADKCEMDFAFTCPTKDNQGTYSWVAVLHQKTDTSMTGSGTVDVTDANIGHCRSTYNITVTKQ